MTSVRLFVGPWDYDIQSIVERIAEHLRHISIEPKAGDDCRVWLEFTIGSDANLICSESDDVQASKKAETDNPVYGKLGTVGQVYKEIAVSLGHQHPPQNTPIQGLIRDPESRGAA
jgi:hypothetical protein